MTTIEGIDMRILKHGNPESRRVYEESCGSCGCVFEATKEDYTRHNDWREGDFWTIQCPEDGCNGVIYRYSFGPRSYL